MNLFRNNPNLMFVLEQYLDEEMLAWAEQELEQFGALCGTDIDRRAVHTDREGQPKLIKYDKHGNDISEVWLNEGYKQTIKQTYQTGIVGYVHKEIPALGRRGDYLYSFAQGYLLSQAEPGFYCPVTLTMATAYLLDHYGDPHLKAEFLPHVIATGEVELYEGATFLTERQGGSDVGANETKAVPAGAHYHLYGEKYFASNAGACGVAMVLARIEDGEQVEDGTKGLSLFLVPWRKENGEKNELQIARLKDKLGVRAVPSAEVIFEGSKGYLVGDRKKGFYYMMEALNLSRVCNAIASLGIMRRAFIEARDYADIRVTFGKKLSDFPMVRATLANLQARQEVQLSATFSLIALFDRVIRQQDAVTQREIILNRLLIALVKLRTADEAVAFASEAIEMHGGNGYIEDFVTPRLLRDAQVLTVWEGTANILALEVLRLLKKYQAHEIFIRELEQELAQIPSHLQGLVESIQERMTKLKRAASYLERADEEMQTYHGKRLANAMIDLYLAMIALKDTKRGGRRKELIAQLFIQHLWGDELLEPEMLAVKEFALLMNEAANTIKS